MVGNGTAHDGVFEVAEAAEEDLDTGGRVAFEDGVRDVANGKLEGKKCLLRTLENGQFHIDSLWVGELTEALTPLGM